MLIAGTRLGPYEVVGPLGAGGMGEVYKGLDTRVDRAVAIKVLPTDAVIDPEAGERFEREARALASLSHPRVCGLFEYTHFNDRAVLILEYLEGQPLSERLARGRLPLPEALRIGCGDRRWTRRRASRRPGSSRFEARQRDADEVRPEAARFRHLATR